MENLWKSHFGDDGDLEFKYKKREIIKRLFNI